jgi:hypothetical protein
VAGVLHKVLAPGDTHRGNAAASMAGGVTWNQRLKEVARNGQADTVAVLVRSIASFILSFN